MGTQVDIIIPTWNGKQLLQGCLASLYRQTVVNSLRITVVDNGSEDDTLIFLQQEHPEVRVISLQENTGFCHAVNLGIDAGTCPFVFLLNNDTELAEDCVEQLLQAALSFSEDFFAAKMLSYSNHSLLDGAGDGFLRGGAGYRLGTMEQDSSIYQRSRLVFGACGGAALYRRQMLEETGLLDEDFFAYLEDVDLNLRACRSGFHCRYIPEAQVYHIGSATTGTKINPFTVRQSTRNSIYLLAKHYSLRQLVRFSLVIGVYQFLWLCFCLKKKQITSYAHGLIQGLSKWSRIRKKHSVLKQKDSLSEAQFAARLADAEAMVLQSIMLRRSEQNKNNWLFRLYQKLFLGGTSV